MVTKERADHIGGAVFLIGLGIITLMRYWWPGILFVIGISLIIRGLLMGQRWQSILNLLITGIGLVFALQVIIVGGTTEAVILTVLVAAVLIILGLAMLFGKYGIRRQ